MFRLDGPYCYIQVLLYFYHPQLFLPPSAGRDRRHKAWPGGALVKTRYTSLPSTASKAPLPQPWMMSITGPYGTLLKVEPLIPGNKRGSIAEISHRNVDMVSAKGRTRQIR